MIPFILISTAIVVSVVAYFFFKNSDLKKWQSFLLVILTPLLTILAYQTIGNPDALNPSSRNSAAASSQQSESLDNILTQNQIGADQIQQAIESLEAKIQENPNDLESLNLLANTYLIADQTEQAIIILEKLIAQGQNDPDTLIKTVDAYAFVEEGVFNLRTKQLLDEAMQKAPNHPQGLWLAGMAAMQSNDTEAAKDYWNRLMPFLGDTPQAQQLQNILNELETSQGSVATPGSTQNTSQPTIKLSVSLDAGFLEKHPDIKGETLVFIIARAKQGSNIPLAAKRITVKDLPVDLEISGQDAMVASNSIDDFNDIVLSAKISRSGDPSNTEGDINSSPVDVDMNDLQGQYLIELK